MRAWREVFRLETTDEDVASQEEPDADTES
jgi:hypothetical protein